MRREGKGGVEEEVGIERVCCGHYNQHYCEASNLGLKSTRARRGRGTERQTEGHGQKSHMWPTGSRGWYCFLLLSEGSPVPHGSLMIPASVPLSLS